MHNFEPISAKEFGSFLKKHPDLESVEVLLIDVNGYVRGKRITQENFSSFPKNGIRFPASIYLYDSLGRVCENMQYATDDGDPDYNILGVKNSILEIPWINRSIAQVLGVMNYENGLPFFADPRWILHKQVEKLKKLNLFPVIGIECEFTLTTISEETNRPVPISNQNNSSEDYTPQTYGLDDLHFLEEFFAEVRIACADLNIPLDSIVKEGSPGQYEINLLHSDNPIQICDRMIFLKRILKHIAKQHEFNTSFMAKTFDDVPGSGMHIHVSMLDKDGNNVYAGDKMPALGTPVSDLFLHSVGGLLSKVDDSVLFFAPNANSYRRIKAGSYAPMKVAWGANNRNVMVRLPACNEKSVRIEHRLPGADANIYLCLSAILAGIHYGITNKVVPPKPQIGKSSKIKAREIPKFWPAALEKFKKSKFIPEYFGEQFHEAYFLNRDYECSEYYRMVTQRDYDWYLPSV